MREKSRHLVVANYTSVSTIPSNLETMTFLERFLLLVFLATSLFLFSCETHDRRLYDYTRKPVRVKEPDLVKPTPAPTPEEQPLQTTTPPLPTAPM